MHDIIMQSLDTVDGSSASRFPEQTGDFKRMADVKLEFADVRIVKWCSQSTGLKVVWADVEGVCAGPPKDSMLHTEQAAIGLRSDPQWRAVLTIGQSDQVLSSKATFLS